MLSSVIPGGTVQCDVYEQGVFHLEWVARHYTEDFSLQRMSVVCYRQGQLPETIADPTLAFLAELVLLRRPGYTFTTNNRPVMNFYRYFVKATIGVFYCFRCVWKCTDVAN